MVNAFLYKAYRVQTDNGAEFTKQYLAGEKADCELLWRLAAALAAPILSLDVRPFRALLKIDPFP
ncbi:MAG: hypothetical protein II747_08150 [Clostridia bacterium]|nr:hypothetical protein [Clostridia bacterium]